MKKMIIAIEGPDMVGKATQAALLVSSLKKLSYTVVLAEVPLASGAFYETIYDMLASGAAKRWPALFQLLHCLNKISCQALMLLVRADVVVLDRWHLSSTVYGIASGLPSWYVKLLGAPLIKPDITIVLDRETKLAREEASDSYESDEKMQATARQMYVSACDGDRIVRVDATGSREEVAARVSRAVAARAEKIGLRAMSAWLKL